MGAQVPAWQTHLGSTERGCPGAGRRHDRSRAGTLTSSTATSFPNREVSTQAACGAGHGRTVGRQVAVPPPPPAAPGPHEVARERPRCCRGWPHAPGPVGTFPSAARAAGTRGPD